MEAGTFVGGSKIDISLEFRTHLLNGLLLFAFGGTGTYFILQLQDGSLLWTMSINGVKYPFTLNDDLINSTYFCDGQWHLIQLKRDRQMKLIIDSNAFVGGDPSAPVNIIALSSYLYKPVGTCQHYCAVFIPVQTRQHLPTLLHYLHTCTNPSAPVNIIALSSYLYKLVGTCQHYCAVFIPVQTRRHLPTLLHCLHTCTNPSTPVNIIALSSYLYVGGIPRDDAEAMTFIHRNQLSQQIQHS